MNYAQNAENKTPLILRKPLKSILFGAGVGLLIGSVFGTLMGVSPSRQGGSPDPAFEKLSVLVGSRFLGVFLLSGVSFGLMGFSLTLGLWILARIQSKN